MRARALIIVALLSLSACRLNEPSTAYEVRSAEYGEDSRLAAQTGQPAEQQARPGQADKPEPVWPRRFTSGDTSFATYEPQVDSWKNDQLQARVAVEVSPPGATTPTYGIVWFEAPTRTDRARGVVTLGDVHVLRAHFPTARDHEAQYLEALRGADLAESKTVAIDRLERQVAYGASHEAVPSQPVKNDPPVILVSDRPEMVVQVDGAPRYRDEGGVQRVINTRALLLSDRGSSDVWVGDRWFRASSIDGTYSEARDVPRALEAAKSRLAASQSVDLYGDATDRVRQGMKVVVSTKPAEVVETRGAPVYERIAGTSLSYVSNTDSDVLRDDASGQTYVLLSGRWFRAPSLGGPWAFVAGRDLPATFRDIPREHREARVLASIPATPESEEATIAASVPQTATVDRGQGRLAVAYDGAPDFQPVQGASAPLQYAVNSETPVIATADGMYYAVENGVWFVSASPDGPWTVATSVPDVIYTIPASSPIHYVTYVRVYGYSPEYAYVGYTPGYLGAFYTDGVIVYGTGYAYRPWIGNVWYGRPYGRPWFGEPGWGPGPRGTAAVIAGPSVYHRWAPTMVHAPPARVAVAPPARFGAAGRVYAPPAPSPRTLAPATPSVAPRANAPATPGGGPRYATPGRPSYAPQVAPRAVAPPSYAQPARPSFAPPQVTPRAVAPPSYAQPARPSFAPPQVAPRAVAPPSYAQPARPSFAPPQVAPRAVAPPSFSQPAAPHVATPAPPAFTPHVAAPSVAPPAARGGAMAAPRR